MNQQKNNMITPHLKTVGRIKTQSKRGLQKKADALYQELGKLAYEQDGCLVCGKEYSCLHHYTPKSRCTALRYDLENGIPICAGCHLKHHTGDPDIHNKINEIKGQEWVDELAWRRGNIKIQATIGWYKGMIEILQTIVNAYK